MVDESTLLHQNQTAQSCMEDDQTSQAGDRKKKSLGELCRKFLSIYGKEGQCMLMLKEITDELGVQTRRLYDIINILEGFCVIRRQAKNSYYWRGIDRIVDSIQSQIVSLPSEFEIQKLQLTV